jgi:spore maturation protein SpmA
MALNYVWIAFFIIGFTVAICKAIFLGQGDILSAMMTGMFDSAKTGFEISLGLAGIMSLWLGIMKIGEKAGMVRALAKLVAPLFRILFPEVPKDHPANGSIVMNLSATMLGLDNAATPLGLTAMNELQELNPEKDTASNAQIMFLVLNTAGLMLIPTSVIAIRQTIALKQGITNFNAADIFLPVLITTFITLISGIIIVSIFQRINLFKLPFIVFLAAFGGLIAILYYSLSGLPPGQVGKVMGTIGGGVILSIVILFIVAGAVKKQNVYNNFIDGAKEGFNVSVRIIPYLVAMLVAISIFRTSGCMDYLVHGIGRVVGFFGLDTDFVPDLPIALMKPLSGGAARGLMVDVMNQYHVDTFQGKLAAIIQGSTETTFYVLAVYFGSVNIKNTRYALAAGLTADIIGLITAIIVGYMFFH